ncbi:eCIS core domain-containing protein [Pseudomonas farris]
MPKVSPANHHCLRENPLLTVFLRQIFRLAIPLFSVGTSSAVFACPQGQYQVCVVACFCAPGSKEETGEIFENMNQIAASGLQNWIVQSRNTAATGDIRTIPLNIRAQLEPYYDIQVLDSARYKVGDDAELNAAHTMLQNPDVSAVTLIDIIVFRSPDDALNNVALWAHELKHVQQYLQWGVREFATRYTRDYTTVEAPAYAIQTQVARALRVSVAQPEPPRNP